MEIAFILTQLSFAALMFVGILVSYLLPLAVINKQQRKAEVVDGVSKPRKAEKTYSKRTLSYCNCFGAGIFVAICFLGLMPVVREEFNELFVEAKFKNVNYPIPEFTILLGFFFVLFFEHFVVTCRNANKPPVLHLDETVNEQTHHLLDESVIDSSSNKGNDSDGRSSSKTSDDKKIDFHADLDSSNGHTHIHSGDALNASGFGFFVLVFATSIHSVFEGLALGLLRDIPKAIHLFIGIILHEILVAFALGINAARLNTSTSANLKFALVFSLTVPVGIIFGIGLGYTPGLLGKLISAVFQGLAAGTFLNVAFLELIPSELSESSQGFTKLLKIMLIFGGFLLMALLSLFSGSHN